MLRHAQRGLHLPGLRQSFHKVLAPSARTKYARAALIFSHWKRKYS
jgi:hypothetical protein